MTVVTRIAPSPTGDPHVGTAYVGLFNYVFARQQGGRFILRVEDTDQKRYREQSERRILEMMTWLGLEPDEDPVKGGPNGPYRQSERTELYRRFAAELLASGHAYRAFETSEELEEIRVQQRRLGRSHIGYDGRARALSAEESERRASAGEPFVIRLKTPTDGETSVHDTIRGEIRTPNTEVSDVVLLKSDGFPTYHLAVVVDDHHMGVTHVIRADDWTTSTPVHALLYRAFGWDEPRFTHLPLLRNPDKSKISKRNLDTSVDSYREQGIVAEALLNFLGTMGWSMPDGKEFFSLDDMIQAFSLERLSAGEPVFDLKRLRFYNAKYLRDILTLEDVAARTKPLLIAAGYHWDDEDYLLDVLDVLRPRAETLQELVEQSEYFFRDDIAYSDEARKRIAAGQKYLEDMEREVSMLEFFDYDSVDDMLREYVRRQEVGMGKVLGPLRAAVTGVTHAPGVTDLLTILGKRRVLQRIGRALGDITSALPDDNPQKETDKGKTAKAAKAGNEAAR